MSRSTILWTACCLGLGLASCGGPQQGKGPVGGEGGSGDGTTGGAGGSRAGGSGGGGSGSGGANAPGSGGAGSGGAGSGGSTGGAGGSASGGAGGSRDGGAATAGAGGTSAPRDGGATADARPPSTGAPNFPKGPTMPAWWGNPVPKPDLTKPPMPDFKLYGFAGEVTGGEGGMEVTVSTFADLKAKAALTGKLIIKVMGKITGSGAINVKADKTIIGVGSDAQLDQSGFNVKVKNVIIRNLIISNYKPEDGVSIAGTAASNIWVDHCEFFTKPLVDDATKDEFDGAIDVKDGARFITISWNHFHDTWKTSLIGSSDSDKGTYEITYHHNYFRQIGSRVPLLRFGTVHTFANYYQEVVISGINSRMGAQALVENNYFERVVDPLVSVDSPQKGGILERNNLFFPPESKMVTAPGREALPGTLMTVPYQYPPPEPADKVPGVTVNWGGVGKISP